MKSITEIIKPIRLLNGSHRNTAKTGSGCVMNVIAYLNGDARMSDSSPCVCPLIRTELIYINDVLEDEDRQKLIPYIERAMGSATDDEVELARRKEYLQMNNIRMLYIFTVYYRWKITAFELLDALLPEKSNIDDAVIERAEQLVAIAESVE